MTAGFSRYRPRGLKFFSATADKQTVARQNRKRGFVLITMALVAFALIGILGLAVDLGRMLIARNETQAYCDASALSAALALDGTSTGIANAKSAVAGSPNKWNFGTTAVTNPTVTFATVSTGPWVSSPSPASGYLYVKVVATVSVRLYFVPVFVSRTAQNVSSAAVAGQVAITDLSEGLAPYTGVTTNTTGPNFGLVAGNSYDIQWPAYNGQKSGCGPSNPTKCFVSPPCSGEPNASLVAVVTNWGSSLSGYWGTNSNSVIEQAVLDSQPLQAVAIGSNIDALLTSGNKASEAKYLDERASEDIDTTDNTISAYLAASHNGRRLLPVAIVDPVDPTHTNVLGYGVYLLLANGPGTSNYYEKNTNGNDPYCALYAGTYNVGSTGTGAGGTTGASVAKLIQ